MCMICSAWENNEIDARQAFRMIGDSLKLVKDRDNTDHLMELCDRVIDSVDRPKVIHE